MRRAWVVGPGVDGLRGCLGGAPGLKRGWRRRRGRTPLRRDAVRRPLRGARFRCLRASTRTTDAIEPTVHLGLAPWRPSRPLLSQSKRGEGRRVGVERRRVGAHRIGRADSRDGQVLRRPARKGRVHLVEGGLDRVRQLGGFLPSHRIPSGRHAGRWDGGAPQRAVHRGCGLGVELERVDGLEERAALIDRLGVAHDLRRGQTRPATLPLTPPPTASVAVGRRALEGLHLPGVLAI